MPWTEGGRWQTCVQGVRIGILNHGCASRIHSIEFSIWASQYMRLGETKRSDIRPTPAPGTMLLLFCPDECGAFLKQEAGSKGSSSPGAAAGGSTAEFPKFSSCTVSVSRWTWERQQENCKKHKILAKRWGFLVVECQMDSGDINSSQQPSSVSAREICTRVETSVGGHPQLGFLLLMSSTI